jgi:hypothetical protein
MECVDDNIHDFHPFFPSISGDGIKLAKNVVIVNGHSVDLIEHGEDHSGVQLFGDGAAADGFSGTIRGFRQGDATAAFGFRTGTSFGYRPTSAGGAPLTLT